MNTEEISCVGCTHHLGAGMCEIHLEKECADGGGYEAYEPRKEAKHGLQNKN